MLEAVLHGALAQGTNGATLLLLNVCLLAFIFVTASLLVLGVPSGLLPHIIFLLLLAVGLLASVNWLIVQTGTVSAEEQRRELFGEPEGSAAGQAGEPGEAAATEQAAGVGGTASAAAAAAAATGAAGEAKDKEL